VRVVIAEDEALLREGLAALLTSAGLDVVGTASDAVESIRLVDRARPDILITDIRMPPHNRDDGLRAAIEVRATHPGMAVMVLSQHVNRNYALDLLRDDDRHLGYLLKQRVSDAEQFCADLRTIANGGTVVDSDVVAAMMGRALRVNPVLEPFTPRQLDVLALLAEGRSNAAIASSLVISERAVVQHVSHIYDQLGLRHDDNDHRRVLAVLRYLAR
jgi:DNA-binding NarL/FixJ family response regulator